MSGTFDPYHRWLGISPKDQPPNHYRLLGIDLFESDLEVIRDATERQMAHVRTYQLGRYVELSQQILNKLASAKACLLDARKKTAYDAALKDGSRPKRKNPAVDDVYALAPPVLTAKPPADPRLYRTTLSSLSRNPVGKPESSSKLPIFQLKWWLQLGGVVVGAVVVLTLVAAYGKLWTTSTRLKPGKTASRRIESDGANAKNVEPKSPETPATRPPKLAKISNRTIDQGTKAQFQVRVLDQGTTDGRLCFSLAPGAPVDATIHPRSGMFTWKPRAPGKYSIKVCVSAYGRKDLGDQAAFRVVVRDAAQSPAISNVPQPMITPKNMKIGTRSTPQANVNPVSQPRRTINGQHKSTTKNPLGNKTFSVELPSGKVLTSADINLSDTVQSEISTLLGKCRANSPDAIGFFQEGSNSVVAALANIKSKKPHGPAVLFHPGRNYGSPEPQYYITYRNGRRNGVLTTWDTDGQQQYWGNYSNGQRHGLCCLLNDETLVAVLECSRDKIDAIHLIAENQIAKSWTDEDEAVADAAASMALQQIDAIEQRLKSDDRSFCGRVKKGIQVQIGILNRQKRAAASARSAGRAAAQEQSIQKLRKAGGW